MRKCEFKDCDKPGWKKILGVTWLCKKHYLIAIDRFYPLKAGRKHCIYLETLFEYLENFENQTVSIKQIRENFNITYPTAKTYLLRLQEYGFVKHNGNGLWKVGKIK